MTKLTAVTGIGRVGLALVGTVLSAAWCCEPVHAAPAGQSTAIAVDGDYVYVVENGSVYKLSSKDLKPVASARLAPAKPPVAAKARVARPARKQRRTRPARRRTTKARSTTWQRVPLATKATEAGLPE